MALLTVQDLNVQFHNRTGDVEAVRGVSFVVEAGEIVGVVGESGSGKSTLMRAVMGLLPDHAAVSFEQCGMTGGREKIAMVFQDPLTYLNPTVKVGRQITETIQVHGKMKRKEAKERALELLDIVGIRNGQERMNQYPFELSGGQRQRIVLAIALACEPTLLIADEPTTALDVTIQRQILERMRRIAEETGTAVLIVSHDLGVIASLADRVLVMKEGEIVESGPVEEVFDEPEHPYTKELLQYAKQLSGYCVGKRAKEKYMRNLRTETDISAETDAAKATELLRAEHLKKRYRRRKAEAVREISFSLYQGENLGIVGESGCGKTTLAGMITGIVEPTEGELIYRGEKLLSLNKGRQRSQTQSIQMVFQDIAASLDPRCTVGETLAEPLIVNHIGSPDEQRERVCELLELVGLQREDAGKYPRVFSGGQRQRIGIARALILNPDILVLDEPVSALDAAIQEQILALLEQIQREKGLTYLFISHDLNVVKRISRHLGVMYAGQFVETGNTKEIYEDPWHPYTKALLSAMLDADPKKARRKRKIRTTEETEMQKETAGCPYASRCRYVMDCCKKECPGMYQFGERSVACFLYSEAHTGKRSASYRMSTQI